MIRLVNTGINAAAHMFDKGTEDAPVKVRDNKIPVDDKA
jgi:hypothetical protein